MKLRDALVNIAQEASSETAIADADYEHRCRGQWLAAIHADIQSILDGAGATREGHTVDLEFAPDYTYADVTIDGIDFRWWANQDSPRGEWYQYARRGVLRRCPNEQCPWPDQWATVFFTDADALAEALLDDPITVHFGPDGRRCDGVTADPPMAPDVAPDPVIVLRETTCQTVDDPRPFEEQLADLIANGYATHVCCDHEGCVTVVAVHR